MNEPFPWLLIVTQLIQPLKAAREILHHFSKDLTPDLSPVLIQGALVMAVAAMAVALADSLKYYVQNFPETMLASTELLFLGLWRAHFHGNSSYLNQLNVRRFDRSNLREFHFLLSLARTFHGNSLSIRRPCE